MISILTGNYYKKIIVCQDHINHIMLWYPDKNAG